MHTSASTYLPHIDGLRALALAAVLLFHFDVPYFSGGYTGVDIFLTISGYLITRNILNEFLETSQYSLSRFYTRRFFRLYPAATATVFLTAAAVRFIFPPPLAQQTLRSALAALAVSANAYFHAVSGYFDSSATVKPLLHMWSLSLEEQFYLLCAPLLAFCFYAFHASHLLQTLKFLLVTLAAASLVCAAYVSAHAPSFAFFHLPARIFQFVTGATLAVSQCRHAKPIDLDQTSESPAQPSQWLFHARSFAAVLATLVLLAAFLVLPESASALFMLPVNISTAVLLASPDAPVSKYLFASTVPVVIGHLSYSAYLVHWPLDVYARFISLAVLATEPNPVLMTVATFVLAFILKKLVEDPVRVPGFTRRLVFFIFLAATVALCMVPLDMEHRQSDDGVLTPASIDAQKFLFGHSFSGFEDAGIMEVEAPIIKKGHKVLSRILRTGDLQSNNTYPVMTLFGNSFSGHLVPALHLIGLRRKVWFRVYTTPSCSFVAPSQWPDIEPEYRECRRANEIMWKAIDDLPPNSTIVLAALWALSKTNSVVRKISPMDKYFTERDIHAIFLTEPPGLSSDFEAFFDCADFFQQPLGKMLLSSTNSDESGRFCGVDFRNGAAPVNQRIPSENAYRQSFSQFKSIRLESVLDATCNTTKDEDNNFVAASCALPVSDLLQRFPTLADPGYKRDLRHFTILGSAAMSHVYERMLFKNHSE